MPDQFQTRSSQNYFQRLANSVIGTLIGIVLVFASIAFLWWNEARAVDAARALDASGKAAISVAVDGINPTNEGKLIHVSGVASTASQLADPETGLIVPAALVLERKVEMYQWIEESRTETREKVGGTQESITTYTYKMAWSGEPVDAANFKQPQGRTNPEMLLRSARVTASDARLGAFILNESNFETLNVDTPFKPEQAPTGWTSTADGLYKGRGTPASPQLGDVRVTYTVIPSQIDLTVMGRQTGNQLTAWTDNRQGFPVLIVERGRLPIDAMVKAEKSEQNIMTWVFRFLGMAICWAGFAMTLGPLKALGNVVPLIASIIGSATGLVAFGLAVALSLLVIAAAWFLVRPILSAGLLIAAGAAWWFTKGRRATTQTSDFATS
jgi:hypothetical protein